MDAAWLLVTLFVGYVVSEWGKAMMLKSRVLAAQRDVQQLLRDRKKQAQQLGDVLSATPFFHAPQALALLHSTLQSSDAVALSVQLVNDKTVSAAIAQIANALVMPMSFGERVDKVTINSQIEQLQAMGEQIAPLMQVLDLHKQNYHHTLTRIPLKWLADYVGLPRLN